MRHWIAALLLVTGCRDLLAPMPGDPVFIAPRPLFRHWYALAEQCSGRQGDFARVRWYWYQHETEIPGEPGAVGMTWLRSHKIALAGTAVSDSAVVIHESLHDVLGVDGHPEEFFGETGKCGHLVS